MQCVSIEAYAHPTSRELSRMIFAQKAATILRIVLERCGRMGKLTSKMTGLTPDTPFADEIERAQTLYFYWLCNIVHADRFDNSSWYVLAKILHNIEYYWLVPNDDNRATDGVRLREKWFDIMQSEAKELGLGDTPYPLDSLNGPCTVLEMLVGLSVRIESEIMQDTGAGNRVHCWFWHMLYNLAVDYSMDACTDEKIDDYYGDMIKRAVMLWLDRDYDPDGTGGLFPVDDKTGEDQRGVEIWYQAQRWLHDNYSDELFEKE